MIDTVVYYLHLEIIKNRNKRLTTNIGVFKYQYQKLLKNLIT